MTRGAKEDDLDLAEVAGCAAPGGLLSQPLQGDPSPEGAQLPAALPPVIDAHVHLFPDRVFDALWRWFETHAWPVRYKLQTPAVIDFLLGRGVEHIVALHYAHRAGMARVLNTYMASVCADHPQVHGMATVLPGEPDAVAILEEGFALGLRGVKLHCHVQCFAPDDPAMNAVYATCAKHNKPLVIHAGREPRSTAYQCDPYDLCGVERIEHALKDHPTLRLCVPHLGMDEYAGYERLLERYDNLWLDTTMVVGDYFDIARPTRLVTMRPERVMYGTDFPSLPYPWDREVKKLLTYGLDEAALAQVLGETARDFFGIA
ncbi:MAG: putative TIM-barrel fold metal-dependent hydrolase [Myxococcota bacterium]|jgi:predicted TIM-barrel fold metal-dependent hydrolase